MYLIKTYKVRGWGQGTMYNMCIVMQFYYGDSKDSSAQPEK